MTDIRTIQAFFGDQPMTSHVYQYGKSQTFFVVENRIVFWIHPVDGQFIYADAFVAKKDLPPTLTGDNLRRRLSNGEFIYLDRQIYDYFQLPRPTPNTIVGHQFNFQFLRTGTFTITI